MLVLLCAAAHASGFFHADDLSAMSEQFARAAESSEPLYTARLEQTRGLAGALRDYELALDLLGDAAPAPEQERHRELVERFSHERAEIEAFANTLMGDFDAAFQSALTRALQREQWAEAKECQAKVSVGPRVPGIPQRTEPNPDCIGADLNAALAGHIDEDPELIASLDTLTARAWPAYSDFVQSQAPLAGEAHLSVSHVFKALAGKTLREVDFTDEQAREPLQAALEQGADPHSLLDQARTITAATAARRAALGAPVLDAVDAVMAKEAKKGRLVASWCANPRALGGCTGEDVTADWLVRLREHKKVLRALP